MSLNVGTLVAFLTLDAEAFNKGAEEIPTKLEGSTTSAFSKVAGIAAKGMALVGGIISGAALAGGISRALNIEDAQAKLKGLGHSTQEIQTIMNSALMSVKGTSFGLDEAATVAAAAVAAGIKPGQDLTKYLTETADAATIAGSSMSDMGGIMNKVQANGNAFTDDLQQLSDRGVPIFTWLQQEYGVSADALSKMVKDGDVDAAHFQKAIHDNIGGAALSAGNTTRGAWANMKAAWSRGGAAIVGGVMPQLKGAFKGIETSLDSFDPALTKVGAALGAFLKNDVMPAVSGFEKQMTSSSGFFQSKFLPALSAAMPTIKALVAAWGSVGGAIYTIIPPLVGALMPAINAILPVAASLATSLGGALAGAITALAPVIIGLATGLANMVIWGTQNIGWVGPLVAGVLAGVAAFKAYAAIMGIVKGVQIGMAVASGAAAAGTEALTGAQRIGAVVAKGAAIAQALFSAALWASPITWIVVGIAALVAGLILLITHWQQVSDFIGTVWGAVLSWVTTVTNGFVSWWNGVWQGIVDFFTGLWGGILTGIQGAWQGVIDFFTGLPQTILDLLAGFGDLLVQVGMNLLRGLATGIAVGVVAIWFFFTQLPTLIFNFFVGVDKWLLTTGVSLLTGMVNGIVAGYQAVVAFFVALPGNILAFVATVATWLITTGINMLHGLQAGIANGYQAVVAFFTALPGNVLAFFVTVGTWLLTTGIKLLHGMESGIQNGYNAVVSFFAALPGRVLAFFAGVGTWLFQTGISLLNGIHNGITNGWDAVMSFFRGIPGAIGGFFAGAGSWLIGAGKNIVQGLMDGLGRMAGAVGKFFLSLLPGWIVGPFKAALGIASPSKVFKRFGGNIGDGLLAGLKDIQPKIDDHMRKMVAEPNTVSLGGDAAAAAARSAQGGEDVKTGNRTLIYNAPQGSKSLSAEEELYNALNTSRGTF